MAEVRGHKAADQVTMMTVEDVMVTRGKAIIWTHHHATADALATILERKWRIGIADGRKPADKRAALIAEMEQGNLDILILGMEAMGEGVNLQYCAATSIFVELAKKSSTVEQCRKRLHRMGQKHPVHAIYLVSDNIVDQFYASLMLYKADLQGKTLDEPVRMLGIVSGIDPLSETPATGPHPAAEDGTKSASFTGAEKEKRNSCDAGTKYETKLSADKLQSETESVTEYAPPLETKMEKRKVGRPRIYASGAARIAAWRATRRDENGERKSPGRPRKYATDAERKAAWRARQKEKGL